MAKAPHIRLATSLPAIKFSRLRFPQSFIVSRLLLAVIYSWFARTLVAVTASVALLAAADGQASALARRAEKARAAGRVVEAYWLFAQASVKDPGNPKYRANRDALAPVAKLVETAQISPDAPPVPDSAGPEPVLEAVKRDEWERESLAPVTHLRPSDKITSYDLRGDERALYEKVGASCGLRITFDPQLDPKSGLRFQMQDVNCQTALNALATATNTFAFPTAETSLFVARDTEDKRTQFEPQTLVTLPVPSALDEKDLLEAANAIRTVLNIRALAWDRQNRTVVLKDRASRVQADLGVLEALLLPRAEISLEVQIVTVDTTRNIHYGISLPTSFQGTFLGQAGKFQTKLSSLLNASTLVTFGGGASLFGLTLGDATVFATYTNAYSQALYDATVRVTSGQTATFHVGDQYPIAQSLYTGFSQGAASIYNPVPQVQLVDLGVQLKLSPRVNGDGIIGMDVEAEYKALGNVVLNTVPSIAQRGFKGSVSLREGEWAIIAGLDSKTQSNTRNGIAGLAQIPGVDQVLAENTRDRETSETLVLIKPTVVRLPMSASISPQYLVGPQRGSPVLF